MKRLIELRGRKKAEAMLREGVRMLDYIADLISSEKIDCHFTRCGRFRAAMQPEHYKFMARDMEDLRQIAGVESFMVPRAEQHTEIGSDVFFGGSVLPGRRVRASRHFSRGLDATYRTRGGVTRRPCCSRGISSTAGGFVVKTARGEISCKNVLIATNGYTDGLVPELGRRILPIGSGLIATDEIPETDVCALLPKNRVYGNTNRVFYYFRAAPGERRIIWGGRVGRIANNTSPLAFRHLARDMLACSPTSRDVPVSHAWDGISATPIDESPILAAPPLASTMRSAIVARASRAPPTSGTKSRCRSQAMAMGLTEFDELRSSRPPVPPLARHAVPVVETWYRFLDATKL